MGTVHFKINQSDKTIPCWVRIKDQHGLIKVPFGRNFAPSIAPLHDVGGHWVTPEGVWTAESGSFEIELDQGPHRVSILNSPWATPIEKDLVVLTRQLSSRLNLEAPALPPPGWVAGDLRVHGISPKIAMIEGEASGMGVVQIQTAYRWPGENASPQYHELLEFSGNSPALCGKGTVVAVNTLNRHPVLGSVSLLHAHRPIFPWGWGWPSNELSGEKDWAVGDWCRQCHRINGVTIWPELPSGKLDYEMVAGLVLGDVDVVELSGSLGIGVDHPHSRLPLLYSLFNHGIYPGIAGASGKDSNQIRTGEKFTWLPVGKDEISFLPDGVGLDRWMSALKSGKPLATMGPWFHMDIGEGLEEIEKAVPFEMQFHGAVAQVRLQIISQEGILWETVMNPSPDIQTVNGFLSQGAGPWFAVRVLDLPGNLQAHGSPQATKGKSKKSRTWEENLAQNRLHKGLEWLLTGKAGYFTPQIADYLGKAMAKLCHINAT